jgi:hypothetical protein
MIMSNEQNIIIYRTADGRASVALYAKDGKIWLNQQQMAELFATSKPNISMHIANILKERELNEVSVVKNYLTTAADGKNYNVVFYSLEMIIAVGYRVRGIRGTQFRQWATEHLTLDYWRKNVDNLLTFQEKDILQGKGSISNIEAENIVKGIYDTFNAKRKQLDAQQADAEDIRMLEDLEKSIVKKQKEDE